MHKTGIDIRAPIALLIIVIVIVLFILGALEVISKNRAASNKTELFSLTPESSTVTETNLTDTAISTFKQYLNEFEEEMSGK